MTSFLDKPLAQSQNESDETNEDNALLKDLQAILDEDELAAPVPLENVLANESDTTSVPLKAKLEVDDTRFVGTQSDNVYRVEPIPQEALEPTVEITAPDNAESLLKDAGLETGHSKANDFYREYKDDFDDEYHEALALSDINPQLSKKVNLKVQMAQADKLNSPEYQQAEAVHMDFATAHEALAGTSDKLKPDHALDSQAPVTNDVGMAMVVLSQFRTKQDSINKQHEAQLLDYKNRARKAVFISYLVLAFAVALLLSTVALGRMISNMYYGIAKLEASTDKLNKELLSVNEKLAAAEKNNQPLSAAPQPSENPSPVATVNPTPINGVPEAGMKLPHDQALSPAAVLSRAMKSATSRKLIKRNTVTPLAEDQTVMTESKSTARLQEKSFAPKVSKKTSHVAAPQFKRNTATVTATEAKHSVAKPTATHSIKPASKTTLVKPAPTAPRAKATTTP